MKAFVATAAILLGAVQAAGFWIIHADLRRAAKNADADPSAVFISIDERLWRLERFACLMNRRATIDTHRCPGEPKSHAELLAEETDPNPDPYGPGLDVSTGRPRLIPRRDR